MKWREPLTCVCGYTPRVRNMNLDEFSPNTLYRVVCTGLGSYHTEGCKRQTAVYHDHRRAVEEWDAMMLGIQIMMRTRAECKEKHA